MIISTDKDILEETTLLYSPLSTHVLETFGWVGTKNNIKLYNSSTKRFLTSPYTCSKYKGWTIYSDINMFYIVSPRTPYNPCTANVVGTYSDVLQFINI